MYINVVSHRRRQKLLLGSMIPFPAVLNAVHNNSQVINVVGPCLQHETDSALQCLDDF